MSFHRMYANSDGPPLGTASRPPISTPMARRHVACLRCRRRKQRCDGLLPACANCSRAGVDCYQSASSSNVSRSRLHYLENRVRELEGHEHSGSLASPSATQMEGGVDDSAIERSNPSVRRSVQPSVEPSPTTQSPSVSVPGSITRAQPLAHEVGLLSLANAADPKYVGPSSGVPFARLIYASAPQSQGLPLSFENAHFSALDQAAEYNQDIELSDLPSLAECQQYAEAYFDIALFLPFLVYDDLFVLLDSVYTFSKSRTWNHHMPILIGFAQVLLVLALGARLLETKLKASFNSSALLASGMRYVNQARLHDSVEGIQVLLLVTLNSFYNPEGLNAWHLLHTIIASCLDLGLQRRDTSSREGETEEQRKRRYIRSSVFWSAYSLDRSLTTILGRPLTLRDEAIDVDFPGMDQSLEVEMGAIEWPRHSDMESGATGPYLTCIYAVRFDRIVAEIKLMLYRVSRAPSRFPWPTDISRWQSDVEATCHALIEEVETRQRGRRRGVSGTGSISLLAVQKLQLKYHQCLMLLYRPSPEIPRPSREAAQTCLNSAIETIRISADLHRFMNMDCTWLSAHSMFVAAITVFYYMWTNTDRVPHIGPHNALEILETAHNLLKSLSEVWSVAKDACDKLESLIPVARGAQEFFFGPGSSTTGYQPLDETERHVGVAGQGNMGLDSNTMDYWSQQGTNALVDELGILREFFDLEWLDNATLDPVPLP